MDVFDAVREKRAELGVPGVAVGVLSDGVERHEGYGVTSVDNPLDVTPDTRFQIGSITKTFTGTVVMYLVARGDLDLDRPVREYLPDLKLADDDTTARVTTRHLLAHTGGWAGDLFADTGWGDDAGARYVAQIHTMQQLTPLGELWSYNNAGFGIAGRVIEVVAGQRYEDVVKELVLDPLGLASTTFWPWEVMTERFAVGHLGDPPEIARPWPVGRSAHSMGGLASTTPDLLRYARLHLDPPPELAPMQEPQAEASGEGEREWVGLTWYGSTSLGTIGHGGGTWGQLSYLILQPARGFALAVLTNHSPNGQQVIDAAVRAAGIRGDEPEEIDDAPVDEYTGTYETPGGRLHLKAAGSRLIVQDEPLGGFPTADTPPPPASPPAEAFFYTRERWVVADGPDKGTRGHFIRGADGGVQWLRVGGRLMRRVG